MHIRWELISLLQSADADIPERAGRISVLAPEGTAARLAKEDSVPSAIEFFFGKLPGIQGHFTLFNQCIHDESTSGYALTLCAVTGMDDQGLSAEAEFHFAAKACTLEPHARTQAQA